MVGVGQLRGMSAAAKNTVVLGTLSPSLSLAEALESLYPGWLCRHQPGVLRELRVCLGEIRTRLVRAVEGEQAFTEFFFGIASAPAEWFPRLLQRLLLAERLLDAAAGAQRACDTPSGDQNLAGVSLNLPPLQRLVKSLQR